MVLFLPFLTSQIPKPLIEIFAYIFETGVVFFKTSEVVFFKTSEVVFVLFNWSGKRDIVSCQALNSIK